MQVSLYIIAMNERFKQLMTRLILLWLLPLSLSLYSGCGGDADTVDPEAVSQSLPVTLTGTIYPQIISVYPANGSTGIPVDTDIVIVFSKPIDETTIAANITIPGINVYAVNTASGYYAIILDITNTTNIPDPTVLAYNTTYTVPILAGIQDREIPPNSLSAGGTFSFTTAVDSSTVLQPRVINATRYPGAGVTGVSRVQPYVEVTFTESINPATVTGNFSISPNIASGVPVVVAGSSNKTWRLPLNTAGYNIPYTVTLTNLIQSTGGAALLDVAGNLIWTYTTETDPTLIPLTVDNVWVSAITDTTATINFTTSKPVARQDCYAVYASGSPVLVTDTPFQEAAVATLSSTHSVTVTGLAPNTLYYFRGGINTAGGVPPVEIISALGTEINFYTGAGAATNTVLTTAAADQNGLQLLQTNGTGSYALWVSNSSDIYGQFFNAAQVWVAGGAAISTPGIQSGIVAITDGFTDAIVVYNESNSLYSKMIFNNGGAVGFRWPGNGSGAGLQGIDLGIAIKAGSAYSACIVHERPVIVSSGVADMPDNGDAANLLYDADVNFSSYVAWLDAGDLMLTNAWVPYTISNQTASPYDLFPYVLRSLTLPSLSLGAFANYYIVDTGLTVTDATGGADSVTSPTELRSTTNADFLLVAAGDIIRNTTDGTWGIATAAGEWFALGSYYRIAIAGGVPSLNDFDTFTIYRNHAGPFTSEAVTNPLWDTAPSALFNPGVNVLTGDFVVNEKNNILGATSAAVSAVDLARDTDYALRLSADIMDNGDVYSIIGLPTGAVGQAVGYSTSAAADFYFTDSHNPFPVAVTPGDIVFNIDQNLSAMVESRVDAGNLTLSADIFNNINEKAAVYTKRGFLVTYVDASDFIRARAFDNADGSPLGAVFNVCTSGTNSNPVAVSDGAGNAIIFYEKGGDIFAKKISAKGEFFAAWGVNADAAPDPGVSVLVGYTIVQALPDRAIGTTGGAYLLAKNAAGNFQLMHVMGSTGAAASVTGVLTGYDPQMAVDSETGLISRVLIVYRAPHVVGVTYYHISAVAYRFGVGLPLWGPVNISSNAVAYNCLQPSITLADNSIAADEFYVSWFDGRYFNPTGYSIFAQRLNTAGLAQWAANGIHVSAPDSMGYDRPLFMGLLYWNDTATPFGVLPIWLDYRNEILPDPPITNTDIYYQKIDDTSAFIP